MFGPYTPTLLAVLTKHGLLNLKTRGVPTVQGKVAVVTGAASGIGEAIARLCAKEGCRKLVLADIAWEHNPSLVEELTMNGCDVVPLTVDVAKKEEIEKMHEVTLDAFGAPHFLFNNAGTGMPGVLSSSEEALFRSFDINFWSVVHALRIFVPTMETHGSDEVCHIMNTASLAGISEATGLYGVTKHAVVAVTEAVSSELAWRRSNVEVSVLCPSYVQTNVVRTTQSANLKADEVPLDLDEEGMNKVVEQLALLPKLISGGMSPESVAQCALEGMIRGEKYIFPNGEHAEAAISDRVKQFHARKVPPDFDRQMERVVEMELTKGRAGE
jgi:NAD(P)-dependent dehydrogenase (short-subunit alcohol dehydrogenase family)